MSNKTSLPQTQGGDYMNEKTKPETKEQNQNLSSEALNNWNLRMILFLG